MLKAGLAPMANDEIVKLLTKLRLMTIPRRDEQDDVTLQTAIYRDQLLTYPADVVRCVLKTQPALRPFWPTWKELFDRLETFARPRRLMHAAIDTELSRRGA